MEYSYLKDKREMFRTGSPALMAFRYGPWLVKGFRNVNDYRDRKSKWRIYENWNFTKAPDEWQRLEAEAQFTENGFDSLNDAVEWIEANKPAEDPYLWRKALDKVA